MQQCTKCGKEFPADREHFTVDKFTRSGFTQMCKPCDKAYRKQRRKDSNPLINQRSPRGCRGSRKIYRELHKDKISAGKILYRKTHKDQGNMAMHRRRARERSTVHSLTIEQWESASNHFNGKCAYCDRESPLTQDHFIAVSSGGEYTKDNIIPVCGQCNCSKGARDFFKWYPIQPFYSKVREEKILKFLRYENNKQQLSVF